MSFRARREHRPEGYHYSIGRVLTLYLGPATSAAGITPETAPPR